MTRPSTRARRVAERCGHRVASCLPPSAWLAVVVQTVFLVAFVATDAYDTATSGEALRVAATYGNVIALFVLVQLVFGARSRRPALVLFVLFVAVNFARFETTGTFDYGFAYENVQELLTPLGRRIAGAQVAPVDVALLFVLPCVVGLFVIRAPEREWPGGRGPRLVAASACGAVLFGSSLAGMSTHESLTSFAASAYRFHRDARRAEIAIGGVALPFVRPFVPSARAAALSTEPERRPHVIVLFLESWSGIYTDRVGTDGRPFTPVLDARRREGLTFDHFYASSIQSSRGRFATMCSLIPMVRGKEFRDLGDAPLHCLPHVMDEAGYSTMIYSASDEPDFERSTEFFGHLGFTDVRFEAPEQRTGDPRVWGVGLQDDAFYKQFFAALDRKIEDAPDAPMFAVAINGSHHYPFDKNPDQVPAAVGSTKYTRNFVASLRAADGWLTTFFDELGRRPALRDALVVLVGDHSFPADEHGIHFNGLGAREESFRTAFALRWAGHVLPHVVRDRAASQIDVAPTIADLLQIRHLTQFVGRSLVADDDDGPPAPMVQPYDGVRLATVLYPYKLEVHEAAAQEHLYDLARDPDETTDLLGSPALARETALLREGIDRIRFSQAVLRAKRVWAAPRADSSPLSEQP